MNYFSIHRTAIVWILGKDVLGCLKQRLHKGQESLEFPKKHPVYLDYFSIHRTAIFLNSGERCVRLSEAKVAYGSRVIRILNRVMRRDGRRTFVSAMKYHADYASWSQGQLTSCKLTWLHSTRSNERACSRSALLSFNPIVHYGIPLRTKSTYPSNLYTGNGSSFPRSIQLAAIGHAMFDVRFLGVGGVKMIGPPCRTF